MITDRKFLLWLRDRLEYVYRENENTDFVSKLAAIAMAIPEEQVTPNIPPSKTERLLEQVRKI